MARGGRSYGGESGSAGGARFRDDYSDYRLFDDELGAQPVNQLFSLFYNNSLAFSDNVPPSSVHGEAGGATNKKENRMWLPLNELQITRTANEILPRSEQRLIFESWVCNPEQTRTYMNTAAISPQLLKQKTQRVYHYSVNAVLPFCPGKIPSSISCLGHMLIFGKMAPASLTARFKQTVTPASLRAYLAEFISTFFYVFAVVGSAMASRKLLPDAAADPSSLVIVAIANTFALSSAVYIAANASGGHVNPAVTFGMAVGGRINVPTALFYWISQMLASVMACIFLKVTTVGQLVPTYTIAEEMTGFGASLLEGVMTFGLVYTVYAAGDPRRTSLSAIGPLAVGLTAGANVLAAGPFSGGSMNPACAFGSAVVAGGLQILFGRRFQKVSPFKCRLLSLQPFGHNPSTNSSPTQPSYNASTIEVFVPKSPVLQETYNKPIPILCKSQRTPTETSQSSVSITDPDGTGAAAPTRGDQFLERQKSFEAAKLVIKEVKKSRRREIKKALKVNTAVSSCYGCGAPLHTSDPDSPGYVDPDTYELKKKHRQLRTVLCGRCRLLSHGHMITAVGGNGGYSGGKQFVSADELREKLSHLRHEKALIVKLVDIVDFNGSFLARLRDLVGANPIILVVTKVDLLPRDTDLNCVGDWVVEATAKKKLSVLKIQKEKKGRDVYILGSANVGKSAFISALLKTMAQRDPAAAAARKYKPIQSAVPGTTLGPIQIDAFLGGGKLIDTPGVHLHHRQAAVVHSEDLPVLAPRSRLRGQPFPNSKVGPENGMAEKNQSQGLNGFSIFWGGLVRVDILKVLPETRLTFYGPKALQIHLVPTDKADEFYKKELGVLLTPPTGKERAEDWRGLELEQRLQIKFKDVERPASDVAISGLGWIAVEPASKPRGQSDINLDETINELHLAVHVPKPVEVFLRPPLPVGKAGAEWYQYRELSEKEEELRPKWHF
ncbi:hypothetical protein OIU84_004230 [Salix udensis]|uniref:CP-type G domain-containing protein n=1 Tax=Salix udensis TaxID=889485 RepID=A0AAD6P472_9ROSI|nr:hypothetical protein OIU84_004230 [Salix udensis]